MASNVQSDLEHFYRWQAGRSQSGDSLGPKAELVGFAANSGYRDIPKGGQKGILIQHPGGTIFIDEFAQLSKELQVFLLDAAEGQLVTPIGAEGVPFEPKVHFVFATNEDIIGIIREDLRYRINATITIPSLAERIEDVFPLVRHILKDTNYRLDFRTWLLLLRCPWRGNVRELQNLVNDAVAQMRAKHPASFKPPSSSPPITPSPSGAASSPSDTKPKATRKSELVPLTFGFFSDSPSLTSHATEITSMAESEAFREVIAFLKAKLLAQGYEDRKRNMGLNKRIADLLGLTPVKLSRLNKAAPKNRINPPVPNTP